MQVLLRVGCPRPRPLVAAVSVDDVIELPSTALLILRPVPVADGQYLEVDMTGGGWVWVWVWGSGCGGGLYSGERILVV